tara:strand:+ start:1885 stop:2172 length:288 start_codon:yes stop_codon:yes gene_type:complete
MDSQKEEKKCPTCPTCGHKMDDETPIMGGRKAAKTRKGGKKTGKKENKKSMKKRKSGKKRPPSKWMMHVKNTKSKMKGFSLKEILKAAAKTYSKS